VWPCDTSSVVLFLQDGLLVGKYIYYCGQTISYRMFCIASMMTVTIKTTITTILIDSNNNNNTDNSYNNINKTNNINSNNINNKYQYLQQ